MENLLLLLFSHVFQNGVIFHDVAATKLIKSGEYRIETSSLSSDEAQIRIHYFLHPHWYAPIKDQQGELLQNLPMSYTREEGYLELEHKGSDTFQNVRLLHLGRVDDPALKGLHHIRVVRLDNKWEAEALYHPSIASTGWLRMALTLKSVPLLGDYTLHSKLR